jgi:hypothetical protein
VLGALRRGFTENLHHAIRMITQARLSVLIGGLSFGRRLTSERLPKVMGEYAAGKTQTQIAREIGINRDTLEKLSVPRK